MLNHSNLTMRMVFVYLALLPLSGFAQDENSVGPSGSGRIDGGQCPYKTRYETDLQMVYSPFKPYWQFTQVDGSAPDCWIASDCLFEASGESRKQQFAATALIMGLFPLTIKDIAWPARRLVFVTKDRLWPVEIIVLSLGLVPLCTGNPKTTRRRSCQSSLIATTAWRVEKQKIRFCILFFSATLLLCFSSLFVMEIYSKRSSLGCPVPIFIGTWHIIALIPGVIHSLFSQSQRRSYERKRVQLADTQRSLSTQDNNSAHHSSPITSIQSFTPPARCLPIDINDENDEDEHTEPTGREREKRIASAVQGANEAWPVQMAWGVYYIAGTLVFTSIMAVTVPELVIWVVLGLATAACSKILAFFLCLLFEDTGLKLNETLRTVNR
ncbi:hypothetical protein FB567DRAFT_554802 [Paraphoma chrysanthemicola]|uniref:Uncharacterized protein n=1 Tax=Paraphoma chrysanthemicola TaxID=798071 RepID=A0A8K0QV22_9PLEO|nr:hypothetical protein FB567DRAFT_554802 [Paraphoma chrysanthemicola]